MCRSCAEAAARATAAARGNGAAAREQIEQEARATAGGGEARATAGGGEARATAGGGEDGDITRAAEDGDIARAAGEGRTAGLIKPVVELDQLDSKGARGALFDLDGARECWLGAGAHFAKFKGAGDTWRMYLHATKPRTTPSAGEVKMAVETIEQGETYIAQPAQQIGLVRALGVLNLPNYRRTEGSSVFRTMVAVQAIADPLRSETEGAVSVGTICHVRLDALRNPDTEADSADDELEQHITARKEYIANPELKFAMGPRLVEASRRSLNGGTSSSSETHLSGKGGGKGGKGGEDVHADQSDGGSGKGGGKSGGRGKGGKGSGDDWPTMASLATQLAETKRKLVKTEKELQVANDEVAKLKVKIDSEGRTKRRAESGSRGGDGAAQGS